MDENQLIFAGWDHGLTDDEIVEAGRLFRRFRKRMKKVRRRLRKFGKKMLKIAKPVLSVAATVYPALAPAAAAVATASKLLDKSRRGSRAARGALKAIAHHAKGGNADARRMLATLRQVDGFRRKRGRYPRPALRPRRGKTNPRMVAQLRRQLPRMQSRQLWSLLRSAQRGNTVAGEAVEYIGACADEGDKDAQRLLYTASGGESALVDRWGAIIAGADPDDWDHEIDGDGTAAGMVLDLPLAQYTEVSGDYDATADTEILAGEGDDEVSQILAGVDDDTEDDTEILAGVEEILAGGPLWDQIKPRLGYRDESEAFGARDAYRLGLEGITKD